MVKLGCEGVYNSFLFLIQNIDCRYSLEPHLPGCSNVYYNHYLEHQQENDSFFF